ncbi:MAG: FtsX-like permease family protein [Vicinamibacteria bacterium]
MKFVLRMAAREMRASWRRLIFFFICVSIGVAAIVALRSVIQNIRTTLVKEAKMLTAADVIVQSSQPWSDDNRALIDERLSNYTILGRTEAIETATMSRPADDEKAVATMIELRALQSEFPLYGELLLESGRFYSHELLRERGAVVRPELLTRLGIEVGDEMTIGGQAYTVRDVIAKEPGQRLGIFRFGPRVLVDYDDFTKSELFGVGGRVRYQILLRTYEASIEPLVETLEQTLASEYAWVRSYRETGDRIGRRLARAENYLSLVGFVIVILGGIGIWSVVGVFMRRKLRSIAILKCVGASTKQIFGIYLLQVLLLGLGGSVLGLVIAHFAVEAVPPGVVAGLKMVDYGLTGSAMLQGIGIGILVSVLFSLIPLMESRHIKPLLLLRQEVDRSVIHGKSRWEAVDRWEVVAAATVLIALLALASWQAGSLRVGIFVTIGFAAVALVLHLTGTLLIRFVKPLGRKGWFPLRHAVLSLSRPGNQTRMVLLAVGLGTFFILGTRGTETNLLEQFTLELRDDAPDMFLIDVQPDQVEPAEQLLMSLGAREVRMVPVLRARVTGVQGSELNLDGYEEVREHRWLGREFTVTYRDRLDPNEQILEGRFWDATPSTEAEVSIDLGLQEDFGIQVGDTMRFDILGRTLSARVTSIREVDWNDARNGGFMFVFRPGALANAPHTFLGFVKAPLDTMARARMQRDVISEFQNVSIVDLRDILLTLHGVVEKLALAITLVGAIALISGAMILVGSVAMTKFQRQYESSILRTLGASGKTVRTMVLLEYGTLGALAGAVGGLGAPLLTWVLCRYLFEIPWQPNFWLSLSGIPLTALGVSIVGVVTTRDILRKKPLAVLRAE